MTIGSELFGQARSHQGSLVKGITQIASTLLADYRHGDAASFTAARSIQVKACQSLELLDVFKAVRVADRSQHDRRHIRPESRNCQQVRILFAAAANLFDFLINFFDLLFGVFYTIRKDFCFKLMCMGVGPILLLIIQRWVFIGPISSFLVSKLAL